MVSGGKGRGGGALLVFEAGDCVGDFFRGGAREVVYLALVGGA